jgi:Carbohydrate family 9 binding domain-like
MPAHDTISVIMRILLSCLILLTPAAAQPPVPRYEVRRAASRIVIDGKLDDKAWAAAAPIDFIFPWEFQTGAKQKTTARILWDDDYLYVGYECEDADIVALRTERDDPTYLDDAVEFFVNPKPSQTAVYFGLKMNARGVLYDYLMSNARYAFKRFNMQGVLLATSIRGTLNVRGDKDQGWSLEVAIPWINFEELSKRPNPGDIWTANLNRWDGVEPDRRLSMWSNSGLPQPNPHAPERFGQLVFVK